MVACVLALEAVGCGCKDYSLSWKAKRRPTAFVTRIKRSRNSIASGAFFTYVTNPRTHSLLPHTKRLKSLPRANRSRKPTESWPSCITYVSLVVIYLFVQGTGTLRVSTCDNGHIAMTRTLTHTLSLTLFLFIDSPTRVATNTSSRKSMPRTRF